MIRCSHCGKLAPTGAQSCQNCGMPLVSGGAGVAGAGQSEQQELPAWLESLRGAHERPVPSGQENRQPFSLDELVDEDSMPSWMRQDRQKLPESGNSDSLPAIPVVSPGNVSTGSNVSPGGFQAGSLIDERSLPGWMREAQGQVNGQTPGAQNVAAQSLVDQQALPPWIKDLGQAGQAPPTTNPYGLPAQPQTPSKNAYGLPVQTPITPPAVSNASPIPSTPPASAAPANFSQGFSAHDLLDVQSMPSWMSGSQGPGQSPGSQPPTRPVPTGQGFAAGELIDQRSVPPWMKDLQGQERSDPQSAMGVPVSGSGQMGTDQGVSKTTRNEGMPAGSLLDKNSMPSWLQESQLSSHTQTSQPQQDQGMSAGSLLDKSAMPAWLQESQLSNTPMPQPSEQGMSVGSLLDKSAMPAWLQESQLSSTPMPQSIEQSPKGAAAPNQNAMPSWMQESQPATTPMPLAFEQGMSAGSLIDKNVMPSWMQENQQGQPAGGQGLSAGSLLDQNAMPSWMREDQPGTGAAQPQTPGQGMSANSLLDANAAPPWMRAGDQAQTQPPAQAGGQGMSAGSLIDMGSMPTWMQESQPGQPAGTQGQGMSAGSLIDMGAMPAWMREANNSQPGSGVPGRPGQVQARPVPSRPRNEAAPQEQSEVAANIFSSMLGVAASAPALPGQDPVPNTNLGVAQGLPMPPQPPLQQPQQPPIPGWQQPPMSQYNQGVQPQGWQMAGTMPTGNPAPNMYGAPGDNQAAGMNNWVQRGNTPQPAWTGQAPVDRTSLGVATGNPASPGKNAPENAQNADPKKKGLFDTIRDFFMH